MNETLRNLFGQPVDLDSYFRMSDGCGKCKNFGDLDRNNFGVCAVNAFGDNLPLHKLYRSTCSKFKRAAKA